MSIAPLRAAISPFCPTDPITLNNRMLTFAKDFLAEVDLKTIDDNLYERHVRFLTSKLNATKCRSMKKVLRHDRFRIRQIMTIVENVSRLVYYYVQAEHQIIEVHMVKRLRSDGRLGPDETLPWDALANDPQYNTYRNYAVRCMKKKLPSTGDKLIDRKVSKYIKKLKELFNEASQRSSSTLRTGDREVFNEMKLKTNIFPMRSLLVPTKRFVKSYAYQILRCTLDKDTGSGVFDVGGVEVEAREEHARAHSAKHRKHPKVVTWKAEYERFYYTLNILHIVNYRFLLFSHHCDVLKKYFCKPGGTRNGRGIDCLPKSYWRENPNVNSPLEFFPVYRSSVDCHSPPPPLSPSINDSMIPATTTSATTTGSATNQPIAVGDGTDPVSSNDCRVVKKEKSSIVDGENDGRPTVVADAEIVDDRESRSDARGGGDDAGDKHRDRDRDAESDEQNDSPEVVLILDKDESRSETTLKNERIDHCSELDHRHDDKDVDHETVRSCPMEVADDTVELDPRLSPSPIGRSTPITTRDSRPNTGPATDIETRLSRQSKIVKMLVDFNPRRPALPHVKTNDEYSLLEQAALSHFFLEMDVQKQQEALISIHDVQFTFSTLEELFFASFSSDDIKVELPDSTIWSSTPQIISSYSLSADQP